MAVGEGDHSLGYDRSAVRHLRHHANRTSIRFCGEQALSDCVSSQTRPAELTSFDVHCCELLTGPSLLYSSLVPIRKGIVCDGGGGTSPGVRRHGCGLHLDQWQSDGKVGLLHAVVSYRFPTRCCWISTSVHSERINSGFARLWIQCPIRCWVWLLSASVLLRGASNAASRGNLVRNWVSKCWTKCWYSNFVGNSKRDL